MDKNVINGYSTFNTVAVDRKNQRLHLVDIKVYSNKEPDFLTQKELEEYQKGVLQKSEAPEQQNRAEVIRELLTQDNYINFYRITKKQLKNASEAFKNEQPDARIVHVLDCGFDDKNIFVYINKELKDEVVARLSISRNSNDTYIDDEQRERFVKLKEVKFANSKSFSIKKVQLKGKTYQKASCLIEYDDFRIEDSTYTVVRITLKDRHGKKIFKKPMLLLTHRKIKTAEQAHGIYLRNDQRSKIEGVFKFIKEVLGWEEFQIQDFESIKNIIALAFFIGGYFYEIESELIKNTTIQYICELGGGKGSCPRYYFLQGLAKILTYQAVEQFVENQGISDEEFKQMKNVLLY